MMDHGDILRLVISPGLSMLPGVMDSDRARAMLLAIGLQESRFAHRRQIGGPARGFYQFEQEGGCKGVMNHHATQDYMRVAMLRMQYTPDHKLLYAAIEDNDTLATVAARLLLWSIPEPLPYKQDAEIAWLYYIKGWRPGKPHRHTWDGLYRMAWQAVERAR